MTKYYTAASPLAELERMMMSIPNFAARHSGIVILNPFRYRSQDVDCKYCTQFQKKKCAKPVCPWLAQRLEAGAVSYQELVRDCFRSLGNHNSLKRRVAALTAHVEKLRYMNETHRRRMDAWQRVNSPMGKERIRREWLAALFLLTSSTRLWARVNSVVSWNRVDFDKVTLRSVDPQDYAIYQAAKSLCTGRLKITASELADEELVYDATLQIIINAMLVARYGAALLGSGWEGTPC